MSPKKLYFRDTSGIRKYLRQFLHHRRSPFFGDVRREWFTVPSHDALAPGRIQSFPQELDLSPFASPDTPPDRLADAIRDLKLFLPKDCKLLGAEDLKITGQFPIDAGGFSDVWVGERNGTTVIIKSYRYNASSDLSSIYLRMCNEALLYNFLNGQDKNFVPFIGMHSVPGHPFCLVFTFLDHLSLREYLKNHQHMDGPKLLLDIARGLRFLHSHGLVHGNLNASNVLVGGDGRARVAGLGTTFAPSGMTAGDAAKSFYGVLAPEIIEPWRRGFIDARSAAAGDVFAFAFLAWEVFCGRLPFADESTSTGAHSILNDCRPDRPGNPELSDSVWRMIQNCWKRDPAERMTSTEIVAILEIEENTGRSE